MRGAASYSGYGLLEMKVSELLWIVVTALLVFQPALQQEVPALSWIDEVVTLLMLFIAAGSYRGKRSLPRYVGVSLACLGLFVVICLLGNALSGIQSNLAPIAIDSFTCVKFFISIVSGIIIFSGAEHLLKSMIYFVKAILIVITIFGLLSLAVDVGMSYWQVRYGLRSYEFVFPHPTYLAAALAGMIVVLSADSKKKRPLDVTRCYYDDAHA